VKVLALLFALVGGLAIGTQPLLNGALGRTRGVFETVLVSVTVSYAGVVLLLAVKGRPRPAARPALFVAEHRRPGGRANIRSRAAGKELGFRA